MTTIDVPEGSVRTIAPPWQSSVAQAAVGKAPPLINAGQPIDLLALINPKAPGVRGTWRKDGAAWVSDRSRPAIMPIPISPQGDYKITMVGERIEGEDSITMGLVHSGHIFTAGVDCFSEFGGVAGIEEIDGHRLNESPFHHSGRTIVNGRPTRLEFTVLKDHFFLAQDGQPLVDWPNADYRRCTLVVFYLGVDESKLFLTTWLSSPGDLSRRYQAVHIARAENRTGQKAQGRRARNRQRSRWPVCALQNGQRHVGRRRRIRHRDRFDRQARGPFRCRSA
jgi:hypothetical protein